MPARTAVKWLSFVAAILNTLCAGSLSVFALYAPQLQGHLHYTSLQVNSIGIACQLGLYLTVPFLGIICDNKGPRVVAAYAAVLAFPAYAIASLAYDRRWSSWILVACYAALGSATVALYLSGLSTVAKNHPNARGLSMAVVTASFGLSSLWLTQVVDRFYRDASTGQIDMQAMYLSFGTLMSLVGLFSACTLRLLTEGTHATPRSRLESAEYDRDDDEDNEDNEETPLMTASAILEPSDKLSPMERMKAFLRDHSSWWYYLAFILLAGPGEVFTNNLGSMFASLHDAEALRGLSASTQVSLFALSSTIGRLAFGAMCDLPSKSPITARMIVLILTAVLLTLGFLTLAIGWMSTSTFWVASVLVGSGYGGLFTVYPAIISIVWGTENFATFWGCLATAPAVGSTVFGILYAKLYDATSREQGHGDLCTGRACFATSTAVFTFSNTLGVLILILATFIWRRRFL